MVLLVRRKLLGSALLTSSEANIYTVPDGFTAEIQTINAHCINSGNSTLRFYLAQDGATFDNTTKEYEQAIAPANTLIDSSTRYLQSGGVFRAVGNNIILKIYGIEYREV